MTTVLDGIANWRFFIRTSRRIRRIIGAATSGTDAGHRL
jgi:hypothetical protein